MAYDQVILIPGGGGPGTGAREVLDLFNHPESSGVPAGDPRWRGWTTATLEVASREAPIGEARTGYDVEANVAQAINDLNAGLAVPTITRDRVPQSTGQQKRRTGWRRLSKGYRTRLERRGISQADWQAGADLRAARGHAPPVPRGAADFAVTMRYLSGPQGRGPDEQRALRAFNTAALRPGWIPGGLSDDVVAALSQLRGTPSRWSGVQFVPAPDGEPWAMIVSFR